MIIEMFLSWMKDKMQIQGFHLKLIALGLGCPYPRAIWVINIFFETILDKNIHNFPVPSFLFLQFSFLRPRHIKPQDGG